MYSTETLIWEGSIAGLYPIKVYVNPNNNGAFVNDPNNDQLYAKIVIGLNESSFNDIISNLTHELLEHVMCMMELCYNRTYNYSQELNDRKFIMDHSQFAEVNARMSTVLFPIIRNLYEYCSKFSIFISIN